MSDLAAVPAVEATLPGTENLVAELAAIAAEMGETEPAETATETEAEPVAPVRGKDGKFKPKAEAKAETEESADPEAPADKEAEGNPTIAERAKFRAEKRAAREALAAERAQVESEKQRLGQEFQEALRRIENEKQGIAGKLASMFENGQYDEFVKALGIKGVESWEQLNDHAARSFASPEYRRVREQEKKLEQLKAEREAEKAENARRQQEWEREQERRQLAANEAAAIAELDGMLKSSADTAVATLAEDPQFARAVLAVIQGDEDLTVDQAAQVVVKTARAHHARLVKAFGVQTPSKSEAGKPASPDRAGSQKQLVRPNKHVSRTTASEASPPADQELTQEQWLALGVAEMKAAARAEAAAKEGQ